MLRALAAIIAFACVSSSASAGLVRLDCAHGTPPGDLEAGRLELFYRYPVRQKDIDEATQEIEKDPDNPSKYYFRFFLYFVSMKYEEARADLDKMIALNPSNPTPYLTRGEYFSYVPDLDKAIQDYTRAIELSPRSSEGYTMRGKAYLDAAQFKRAIEDFTKAIELEAKAPGSPGLRALYDARGEAYTCLGDMESAIRDYEEAAQGTSVAALEAWNNLAWTRYLLGQFDQALFAVGKALKLPNGRRRFAHDTHAHILAALGRVDEAVAAFEQAIAGRPNFARPVQVRRYQQALRKHGYEVRVDGVYDLETRKALRRCLEARCRLIR